MHIGSLAAVGLRRASALVGLVSRSLLERTPLDLVRDVRGVTQSLCADLDLQHVRDYNLLEVLEVVYEHRLHLVHVTTVTFSSGPGKVQNNLAVRISAVAKVDVVAFAVQSHRVAVDVAVRVDQYERDDVNAAWLQKDVEFTGEVVVLRDYERCVLLVVESPAIP